MTANLLQIKISPSEFSKIMGTCFDVLNQLIGTDGDKLHRNLGNLGIVGTL